MLDEKTRRGIEEDQRVAREARDGQTPTRGESPNQTRGEPGQDYRGESPRAMGPAEHAHRAIATIDDDLQHFKQQSIHRGNLLRATLEYLTSTEKFDLTRAAQMCELVRAIAAETTP